jgi:hypothetical protein
MSAFGPLVATERARGISRARRYIFAAELATERAMRRQLSFYNLPERLAERHGWGPCRRHDPPVAPWRCGFRILARLCEWAGSDPSCLSPAQIGDSTSIRFVGLYPDPAEDRRSTPGSSERRSAGRFRLRPAEHHSRMSKPAALTAPDRDWRSQNVARLSQSDS